MFEEIKRKGQHKGGGFYDYDEKGKKIATWPGLKDLFSPVMATSISPTRM